jgi:glycosyltransferase involved in cell wall biosynthesis
VRLIAVLPVSSSPHGMIFAKRQMQALGNVGIKVSEFAVERRLSPIAILRQAAKLRRLVRSTKADLVFAQYGTVTALIAVLASLPARRPVIYFRGSDLNPWRGEGVVRALVASLLSQVSACFALQIVCVSEGLRSKLWFGRSAAAVIPSGVDFNTFLPGDQRVARARLGWTDGAPVVLFNGGEAESRPLKRLDLARRVVWSVRNDFPDIRLEVVGDVEPDLMPLYYAASDCLLLTSVREGSPNVVKEAAACGLPVVTVNVGDVETSLTGVSPSWIVEANELEISAALKEAMVLRQRSNGPEVCRDRFSQEAVTARLADLLFRCSGRDLGAS